MLLRIVTDHQLQKTVLQMQGKLGNNKNNIHIANFNVGLVF